MISININGKRALLKKGSSFEYIKQNILFESTEGFTLDMEFPLRGCRENVEAFGACHLPSGDISTDLLPCTIQAGKVLLKGSLAIMSADESSIKCQFLDGVDVSESEEALNETYINELDLGSYPEVDKGEIIQRFWFRNVDNRWCIPWTSKEYDVVNNKTKPRRDSEGNVTGCSWDDETKSLTWQPHLYYIIQRILVSIGYNWKGNDFDKIFTHPIWNNAIICNTLPPSWEMPNFADALPAWSVLEFFEKLGNLMGARFVFDHVDKTISYSLFTEIVETAGEVVLKNVSKDFSASVSRDEEESDFLPARKFRYKAPDDDIWKYWDCPEFLKNILINQKDKILEVDSWEDIEKDLEVVTRFNYWRLKDDFQYKVIYIRNIDTYFLLRSNFAEPEAFNVTDGKKPWCKFNQLTPLNIFGPDAMTYDENEKYEELDFVPVTIDWTDHGQMMILPIGTLEDDEASDNTGGITPTDFARPVPDSDAYVLYSNNPNIWQNELGRKLQNYQKKEKGAYFDTIYIGLVHEPLSDFCFYTDQWGPAPDINIWLTKFDKTQAGALRLKENGNSFSKKYNIEPKVKYEFSFIADDMPDVNAVFLIFGKKYVCRQLTVTISGSGISKLIKGEFYRITD